MIDQDGVEAEEIVRRSMKIAGDICVYTNHSLRIEQLEASSAGDDEAVEEKKE